jgi:uncharacterized protein YndB with AHSA1/START domain
MTIAPIIKTVVVKTPPPRAFDLFTGSMGQWWPRGATIGAHPHEAIVIEPRVGGRWYEADADGVKSLWGEVLAWEPPTRLLLGWKLNSRFAYDPGLLTEVELTFAPQAGGRTLVTLEHRHLERLGVDAARTAEQLGDGWPARLQNFVDFTGDAATSAAGREEGARP